MNNNLVDDLNIAGNVVVVTGAGRGIGRGIAHYMQKSGAIVVALEYRENRLADIAAELKAIGGEHLELACDVGDRKSVFDAINQAGEKFGRIEAIVNNAQSFVSVKALEEVEESDMDILLNTGPKGTLWAMQAVFPYMKKQNYGRIVNVASSSGMRGSSGYGPYNTSKEAIRGLTRTAGREWAKFGIVVNCYCPASALHRMPPEDDPDRAAAFAAMYQDHPMGRDGDAEHDIAPAVTFLCSPACRYMTGQTLMLDGGGFMFA